MEFVPVSIDDISCTYRAQLPDPTSLKVFLAYSL